MERVESFHVVPVASANSQPTRPDLWVKARAPPADLMTVNIPSMFGSSVALLTWKSVPEAGYRPPPVFSRHIRHIHAESQPRSPKPAWRTLWFYVVDHGPVFEIATLASPRPLILDNGGGRLLRCSSGSPCPYEPNGTPHSPIGRPVPKLGPSEGGRPWYIYEIFEKVGTV